MLNQANVLLPVAQSESSFSSSMQKIVRLAALRAMSIIGICVALAYLAGCGSSFHGSKSGVLGVSPAVVDLGDIEVGVSSTGTVSLSNQGSSPLLIGAVDVTGTGFSLANPPTFPVSIPAGGSQSISVSFMSNADGDFDGQFAVVDSQRGALGNVKLHARGTHGRLTLSSTALDFGSVSVNTPSTQTLTLTSAGTASVRVDSVDVSGAGFSVSGGSLPATLAPGQSLPLQITFNPSAAGAVTGNLTIASAARTRNLAVSLSGTGVAPTTAQLTVSPTSLAFGSTGISSTLTRPVVLTSSGSAALTINSVVASGPGFSVSSWKYPLTLNPGQSQTLQVSFDPTTAGSAVGSLTITSNSAAAATTTIALDGSGAAANPVLSLSTTTLAFGSVSVGTPLSSPLILTSSGTSPVTVSAATLSGTGFSMSGATFPVTLNPGIAITLQVQFDPTAASSYSGNITISSNSTNGASATVNLTGTGAATQHHVVLNWTAPANSPVPVVGYNIFRAPSGSSSFQVLNASPDTSTTYTDSVVSSGATYIYYVESVDSAGVQSSPSNHITVVVP